jgi:hypothetical protein
LFEWKFDTIAGTRDWACLDGTTTTTENRIKTVTNTTFNSVYNQSLLVGGQKNFNVSLTKDQIYESGFYTEGTWTNQQIGKYQQAYIIVNLPENLTNCSDDMAYSRSDNQLCTVSANGCDISTDTDGDSLSDCNELFVSHLNPKSNDTDEDGQLDGDEITLGYDANLWTSHLPPNITSLDPLQAKITNPLFNFTGNGSAINGIQRIELYLNYVLNTTITYVAGETQALIGIPLTLIDGAYEWFFKIFDTSGLYNYSSNNTFELDSTQPTISNIRISPSRGQLNISDVTFNFTVADANLDSYYFDVINESGAYIVTKNTSNNVILDHSLFPNEGPYSFIIFANDTFGNNITSSTYGAVVIFKDIFPPTITVSSPLPNTNFISSSVSVNLTVNISDENSLGNSFWTVDNFTNNITLNVTNHQVHSEFISWAQSTGSADYQLQVCAYDMFNNFNCTIVPITYTIPAPSTGGGGGGFSVESPKNVFPNGTYPTNKTYPFPINKIFSVQDYYAEKINPTNHKLGVFIFWAILVSILPLFFLIKWITKNYELRKF